MEAIDGVLSRGEDLSSCELFVTCEPCIMCAGALSLVGIRRTVFGCNNDKFGGCGTVLSVHMEGCGGCAGEDAPGGGGTLATKGGVLGDEAVALFRKFYERGNPGAPKPHRKVQAR